MKKIVLQAGCSASALWLCAAPPLHAASTLPETVVTATRVPVPVTDVIADVTLITREVLDQAGQLSLREVLSHQPGVQLTSNGSYRSNTGLFLRGASSSQTLVLVDGIRVGSATSGGAALENIPLARIERIEILRGAASALYGPDAVGGVVQIFTREPTERLELSANAGMGTDGQQQMGAALRGGAGGLGYSVGLSREKATGISVTNNPVSSGYNEDADGFTSTSVDVKLSAKVHADHALTLSLLRSEMEYQFDGTPFPNPLGLTKFTSDARAQPRLDNAAFKWQAQWMSSWKSTVQVGTSDEQSVSNYFRMVDGAWGGSSKFNTQRRQLTWQNDITLGADVLSLMLENRTETVDSSSAYTLTRRDVRSALASYALNGTQWNALAVVRNDDNSQFGSVDNWALSGGYRVTQVLRVVASVGTSFQAPTFNQLYFPGFGNAALVPQRNRATELGLKYLLNQLNMAAVVYHNDIQGFIAPSTNVQSALAVLRGVTLSADWRANDTTYAVSYDYADPRSFSTSPATNDQRLVRIAQNVINARVTQRSRALRVFGELKLASEREDAKVVGTGRETLPGYGLLNMGASWKWDKNLTVSGRINNLTDTQYMLANGYSMPGRNVFVSLEWAQ